MFYENPFSSSHDMYAFKEIVPPSFLSLRNFLDAVRNVYFPIQRDKESSSSNAPQKEKVIVKQPKRIYPLTYHLIADLGAFSDKCVMIKECLICTNNVRALAQNNLVKQKLENENETLKTKNEDLSTKLKQEMLEKQNLLRDLEIMKSLSRQQDEEMGIYLAEMRHTQYKKEKLEDQLHRANYAFQDERKQLERNAYDVGHENFQLQKEISDVNTELKEMELDNEAMVTKIAALKKEIGNLHQGISRKTAKTIELTKTLQSEKASGRIWQNQILEQAELIRVIENELHEKKQENATLRAEIKEECTNLQKENQGLNRAMTRKNRQLEELGSKIQGSEKEINSLLQLLQNTQNQLETEKGRNSLAETAEEEFSQECRICFESYDTEKRHKACSSTCGHVYCYSCLVKQSKDSKRECPFCKKKIGQKIKLFDE